MNLYYRCLVDFPRAKKKSARIGSMADVEERISQTHGTRLVFSSTRELPLYIHTCKFWYIILS